MKDFAQYCGRCCSNDIVIKKIVNAEIISKQPKRGVNWVSKNFAMLQQNLIQILNEFKATISKSTKI